MSVGGAVPSQPAGLLHHWGAHRVRTLMWTLVLLPIRVLRLEALLLRVHPPHLPRFWCWFLHQNLTKVILCLTEGIK